MRTLALVEFLTVDGVMQGLGSPEEDTSGGFTHGGWGAEFGPAMGQVMDPDGLSGTSAYLFGRRTFEKMAAFWPFQGHDNPIAAHLNATPKFVLSGTLTTVDWAGTTILTGDLDDEVRALKADGPGSITVLGSGVLSRALLAAGLVDELRLFIHPLLMGTGTRLFGSLPDPRRLTLRSVGQTDLGTVALTYVID
ncbi:dihydrofolate reductase family protein [Nakamurella sp.]|uniref:dihydrofolate reductase family protein n=1 Tax=Nakamurella sp. TaxID=1869182 RepID=UPI003784E70C